MLSFNGGGVPSLCWMTSWPQLVSMAYQLRATSDAAHPWAGAPTDAPKPAPDMGHDELERLLAPIIPSKR